MKECLSLWGFGEGWGVLAGYVGKIIDSFQLCNMAAGSYVLMVVIFLGSEISDTTKCPSKIEWDQIPTDPVQ